MSKRKHTTSGKVGVLILLVSFIFLPILPTVSFAAEDDAAGATGASAGGGQAGAGAGSEIGTAGYLGLAAVLAAGLMLIAAAAGDDAGGIATGHHGTTGHHGD